jgi:hypothetical protein
MARRDDIFAAIDRAGLEEKGGLRAWMLKNHDAFAERLKTMRPDWDLLASVFANAGKTDMRGKLPTKGETVRKTWLRVRNEVKASQRTQPVRRSAVPPARPVAAPVETRPAQPSESAPAGGNPAMDDVLAEWDARRPKMPEPLKR